MFAKLSLQQTLVSAFLIMGLLVLAVAFVGYSGTEVLSNYINTLSQNSLPSVKGLWKINQAQTQIESSERLLLVPELLPQQRQATLNNIDNAWSQINDGFNLVDDSLFKTTAEKNLYKDFLRNWNQWQQSHQAFMQLEQEYHNLGIRNPEKLRADLLAEGKRNSPKLNAVSAALVVRNRLYQTKLQETLLYQTADRSVLMLLENRQTFNLQVETAADNQVSKIKFFVAVCLGVATLTSMFLVFVFSFKFAKYIDKRFKLVGQVMEKNREIFAEDIKAKNQELALARQKLKLVQSQLIQSEKMSLLGQMMVGLANEINNPVNFIYGNLNYADDHIQDLLNLLQLYQRQYPHPATQIQRFSEEIDVNFITDDLHKMFSSMKLGTDRIRQIIIVLRNFSRIEPDTQMVNIHEGIDGTLLILNHRLKRGIKIVKNYGKLPLVECYPNQINLVIMNILSNAIDAMQFPLEKTNKQIGIQTEFLGERDEISIKIRDNGCGIPEQLKNKIFDPFFTTNPAKEATGLGLYISDQIIQNHGGKIEVFSEVGKETELVIIIPVKRKAKDK